MRSPWHVSSCLASFSIRNYHPAPAPKTRPKHALCFALWSPTGLSQSARWEERVVVSRGVCRGDITAARSASICPRVLALAPCIVFLSAARWQSSASRGCVPAPRRRRPQWPKYSSHSASMAAAAAASAVGEPGVPAMRGSMTSSSPWLPRASGLSALPRSTHGPLPSADKDPPMWKLFLDNLLIPGVSPAVPGRSPAVPGELFYPPFGASLLWLRRECWAGAALRGACAAAVVALGVAGLLRLPFGDHWEKVCRVEHCRRHDILEIISVRILRPGQKPL